jgi:hypothetical protein
MSLPLNAFRVTLAVQSSGRWRQQIATGTWSADAADAVVLWQVRERDRLRIAFEAGPPGSQLWMEGLEGILRPGESLLIPTQEDLESDLYPWYPGAYSIRVASGDQLLWGMLEVQPKELSAGGLQDLRADLEQLVAGLTLDVSTRGYMRVEGGGGEGALHQLSLLRQAAEELRPVLRQIEAEPLRALGRAYDLLPLHRARRLDGRSFRWLARGEWIKHEGAAAVAGDGPQVLLAPRPQPSYDTEENRMIAWVLSRLAGRARRIAEALGRELAAVVEQRQAFEAKGWAIGELRQREEGFRAIERLAVRLCREFDGQRRRPYLEEVGPLSGLPRPTITLQKESRYRQVYAWYQRLERAANELPPSEQGARMQVKRTSLLYEYWSLFRLLHLLASLGYRLEGGRLADQLLRANRGRLIPVIPEGETFWLSGPNGGRIAVTYDGPMDRTRTQAIAHGSPLYLMSSHNRPDLRLDLYREDQYRGSILADAKYAPAWNVWSEREYGKAMPQLQAYATGLRHVDAPRQPATLFVLALYPGRGGSELPTELEGGLIHLVPLRPGLALDQLHAQLRRLVGDEP